VDADPLSRGDETLLQLCCMSSAQRVLMRRRPPRVALADPARPPAGPRAISLPALSLASLAARGEGDDGDAAPGASELWRAACQAVLDNIHLIEQSWTVEGDDDDAGAQLAQSGAVVVVVCSE